MSYLLIGSTIAGAQAAPPPGSLPPAGSSHAEVSGAQTIDATGQGSVKVLMHVVSAAGPFPKGTPLRAVILSGDARLVAGPSADVTTDAGSNVTLTLFPGRRAAARW